MTHRNVLLAGAICIALTLGCSAKKPDIVILPNDACLFPPALATTHKDNTYKFAGEATSITSGGLGAKAEVDVKKKLDSEFPSGDVVNRLYAVSYAGCVACRVTQVDKDACFAMYRDLYAKVTSTSGPPGSAEEDSLLKQAASYRNIALR